MDLSNQRKSYSVVPLRRSNWRYILQSVEIFNGWGDRTERHFIYTGVISITTAQTENCKQLVPGPGLPSLHNILPTYLGILCILMNSISSNGKTRLEVWKKKDFYKDAKEKELVAAKPRVHRWIYLASHCLTPCYLSRTIFRLLPSTGTTFPKYPIDFWLGVSCLVLCGF